MPKFKPGDVVLCDFDGNEAPVIVGDGREFPGFVDVRFIFEDDQWLPGGTWDEDLTRLHPDPDPVWADFCKWRLTNASD